jgi:hypothetical protein
MTLSECIDFLVIVCSTEIEGSVSAGVTGAARSIPGRLLLMEVVCISRSGFDEAMLVRRVD